MTNTIAIVDPWRDLDRKVLGLRYSPAPMAARARVEDDAAGTLASGARLLDREKALLHANLSDSAAGRATDRLRALGGSAATALLAADLCRHLYGDFVTAHGAFEIQSQFVRKVGSPENLAAPPTAAAEDIAEHVAENVTEPVRAEAAGTTASQAFVPELVVGGAFVGVVQDVIRFPHFLEFAGGVFVVLAAVGMMLHGQPPI